MNAPPLCPCIVLTSAPKKSSIELKTPIVNLELRLSGKKFVLPVKSCDNNPILALWNRPLSFLTQKVMSQLNWLDRGHRGTKGLILSNLSQSVDWHHL